MLWDRLMEQERAWTSHEDGHMEAISFYSEEEGEDSRDYYTGGDIPSNDNDEMMMM